MGTRTMRVQQKWLYRQVINPDSNNKDFDGDSIHGCFIRRHADKNGEMVTSLISNEGPIVKGSY